MHTYTHEIPSGHGLSALVVDDDPDINRLILARLSVLGFTITAAPNGEVALRLMADKPADLVFLDVALPGISGLEVLDSIRSSGYDTAVIMTTAYGSERVAIDALRRGADDYLRKPFEPIEFKAVLRRTTARLLLNRQNTMLHHQLEEKSAQLEQELANAAKVQSDLLPRSMPIIPGFELAAECVPAREVGGDFYDWRQPSADTTAFWLCDVMGKGMSAALLMATVRAVMRAVVRHSTPSEAMQYVTAALDDDFDRTSRFVTLFLGQLHGPTRQLRYVDAGHGHVFLRRASGKIEMLSERGMPVGVMPNTVYGEGSITFSPGDALLVYSDGVIDARPELELTPKTLARHLDGAGSAWAMVDRIVGLLSPIGVPPDDFTIMALRCLE
ncbi:SpoIIE family protein phosphatase [Chloroflexia bacterium SDU3-3]|nr:SpoIIE family protein phosphatase [Chloroflexia bacterium SDU3-3]